HRRHGERADQEPATHADLARHRPGGGLGALAEREAQVQRLHDLRRREAEQHEVDQQDGAATLATASHTPATKPNAAPNGTRSRWTSALRPRPTRSRLR